MTQEPIALPTQTSRLVTLSLPRVSAAPLQSCHPDVSIRQTRVPVPPPHSLWEFSDNSPSPSMSAGCFDLPGPRASGQDCPCHRRVTALDCPCSLWGHACHLHWPAWWVMHMTLSLPTESGTHAVHLKMPCRDLGAKSKPQETSLGKVPKTNRKEAVPSPSASPARSFAQTQCAGSDAFSFYFPKLRK